MQLKWSSQCNISIAHCTRYSVTRLISCWFDLEKLFGRTEKSYVQKGLHAAERFRDLQLHICIYGRNATQYKAKYHLLMIVTFSSICICIENINKTLCTKLKGLFTIFLFSVRSHILNSNGVWYWWFCPEGPINAPNSRFLGFYFVPRDLDSQRHMGPRLAAQGTLTRGASRGPIWRRESRSPGDKIKTQKSWVLGIFRPLRAKSPIPHPITIQNMRSDRK